MAQFYEYRCVECGTAYTSTARDNRLYDFCNVCGTDTVWQRVWSVAIHRPMQEHFNVSVGRGISDPRQFADVLKRKSDEATEHTGIEHRYVPRDYSELKAPDMEG